MFRNCHLINPNAIANVLFTNVPFPSVFWLTVDGGAESSVISYGGPTIIWSSNINLYAVGGTPNTIMFVAVEGTPPFVGAMGSTGYTGVGDGAIFVELTPGYDYTSSSAYELFTLTFNGTSFNVVGSVLGPCGIVTPDVLTSVAGINYTISTGGIPFSNGDAFTAELFVTVGGGATKLFGTIMSTFNSANGGAAV